MSSPGFDWMRMQTDSSSLEITPQEVAQLLSEGEDFLFMDCRKPEERETAQIQGTTLIPMQDLELHLPELARSKSQRIIVHCHKGRRSMTVTLMLLDHGFTNVRSMAGGIDRWSEEIDPAVPKY